MQCRAVAGEHVVSGPQMPDDLNRDLVKGTTLRDLNYTFLDAWPRRP